jgi:hypothetical protein
MPNLISKGRGAGGYGFLTSKNPISYSYVSEASYATAAIPTYAFTSVSLGDASNGRTTIVVALCTGSISACTIGGVSATQAVTATSFSGPVAQVWIANTASLNDSVSVTLDGNLTNPAIKVYRVLNLKSYTPTSTYTDIATAYSASVTLGTDSLAIGGFISSGSATQTLAGMTTDNSGSVNSAVFYAAGSYYTSTAEAGRSVTWTTASGTGVLAIAVFK